MPDNALVLEGDHGQKRLTREDLDRLDILDLELLQLRIDEYIKRTPGLVVEWAEDVMSRDILVRWRTQP